MSGFAVPLLKPGVRFLTQHLMSWTELITAAVALYGAALSTYVFWAERKDKRRHVRVSISNGFLALGPELSPPMLLIEATNPGSRTVVLNTPGISLPDRKQIVFPNPQSDVRFPHALAEGTKCIVWTPIALLARQLWEEGYRGKLKLRAFFRDQIGTRYKSNKMDLDLDEWYSSNRDKDHGT